MHEIAKTAINAAGSYQEHLAAARLTDYTARAVRWAFLASAAARSIDRQFGSTSTVKDVLTGALDLDIFYADHLAQIDKLDCAKAAEIEAKTPPVAVTQLPTEESDSTL